MAIKYIVTLTPQERRELTALITRGKAAARKLMRARIVLQADEAGGPGSTDEQIVAAVHSSPATVHRVRQVFVEEGMEAAINAKKPTDRQYHKLNGRQEARLIAIACGQPPAGRTTWTMQLLADKLVELKVVDSIGRECVRTTLKKTTSSLGSRSSG